MAMNEKLVKPLPMAVVHPSQPGADNVCNDRLGRVARYPSGGGAITLDLGSPQSVDTIAALATNYLPGTQWAVLASNNVNMSAPLYNLTLPVALLGAQKRMHRQGLRLLDQPIVARYWQIQFSNPGGGEVTVGRIVLGKSYTASDTMDVGYAVKIVDLGTMRRSTTALDDPTIRGKAFEHNWVWSWMTEQEARGELADILSYAGTTRDLLAILNPDAADLHNVIAYGKLQEEVELVNVAGGAGVVNAFQARLRLQSRLILNL